MFSSLASRSRAIRTHVTHVSLPLSLDCVIVQCVSFMVRTGASSLIGTRTAQRGGGGWLLLLCNRTLGPYARRPCCPQRERWSPADRPGLASTTCRRDPLPLTSSTRPAPRAATAPSLSRHPRARSRARNAWIATAQHPQWRPTRCPSSTQRAPPSPTTTN